MGDIHTDPLLQELEIPPDLEPYVKLQNCFIKLNLDNYKNSLNTIIELHKIINFHEICNNALWIASKHLRDAPLIAHLLSDLCKKTNNQIEIKLSQNILLWQMFEVFDRENVLTLGAKANYQKLLRMKIDPIVIFISNDDVQGLAEYHCSFPNRIRDNVYFFYVYLSKGLGRAVTSYLNLSAYFGSVKCFKYLLLEGLQINNDTPKYAVMGGSNEIIRICVQEELDFGKELITAAYHFRNDIYDWILLNYKTEPISFDLISMTNNIQAVYAYISKRPKIGIKKQLFEYLIISSTTAVLRVYQYFYADLINLSYYKFALRWSSLDVVKLLYDPKFDEKTDKEYIEESSQNRISVLKFAYKHKNPEICIDLTNAMKCAIQNDDVDIARYLLKHGAKIFDQIYVDYYTRSFNALHHARSNEMFELLLSKGANVQDERFEIIKNLFSGNGIKPSNKIISLLVKKGFCINERNFLLDAVCSSTEDNNWVPYLLKNGANPHCSDRKGSNALHYACKDNKLHLIDTLIQAGIDPNAENNSGQRPICLTTQNDVLLALLKNGARTDFIWKRNPYIITLYLMCLDETIKTIAFCGHNINYYYKKTPLFLIAARSHNYEIAELAFDDNSGEVLALLGLEHRELLDTDIGYFNMHFHQNPNKFATITNKRGDTALHYVMTAYSKELDEYEQLVKELLDNGADVNAHNNEGITPAMNAIKTRNQSIKFLWDKIDLSAVDKNGRSVVHYAAMYDFMWNSFLLTNTNVSIKDNYGMLPYQLAPLTSKAREALTPIDYESQTGLYNYISLALYTLKSLFLR